MLEKIIVASSHQPSASVIWMHGLGADGYDFEPLAEALQLPQVRFILPHAPYRPITLNNGYEMRAWYDIFGLDSASPQDETGIRTMQLEIEALIAQENALGVPAERIVLAGFSQGGAIALHTATRYSQTLAGVLALSTYLPLRSLLAKEKNAANLHTPILMAHGQFDSVISLATAKVSAQALTDNGYLVDWHEYPMAHSVCNEEIAVIRQFLCKVLHFD